MTTPLMCFICWLLSIYCIIAAVTQIICCRLSCLVPHFINCFARVVKILSNSKERKEKKREFSKIHGSNNYNWALSILISCTWNTKSFLDQNLLFVLFIYFDIQKVFWFRITHLIFCLFYRESPDLSHGHLYMVHSFVCNCRWCNGCKGTVRRGIHCNCLW